MGTKSSKHTKILPPTTDLSPEEIANLQKVYTKSRRRSSIRTGLHPEKDNLAGFWKQHAEKDLIALFNSYLLNEEEESDFQQFCNLFFKLTKAPCEETADFIFELLDQNNEEVTYHTVVMYVKDIISSYFMILTSLKDDVLRDWVKHGIVNIESTYNLLAESLCQELKKVNVEHHFVKWYTRCSQFQNIQTVYVYKLFQLPGRQVTYGHQTIEKHLLPMLSGLGKTKKVESVSVLTIADVLFLNVFLPEEKQFEWKLCFSTTLNGLSFGKMMRMIIDKGPNIIIVKDKTGHKFGGYASSSWKIAPTFQGTDESFLFTLHPAMQIHESSGYNNHYQYLNSQQQTLPNGLGMGGQFDYFGLWLDADFGTGHCSETCTTFKHYKMLSSQKYFEVDHVEVWAIVQIQQEEEEEESGKEVTRQSILDKDAGAKALLEIAGREMASDGYQKQQIERKVSLIKQIEKHKDLTVWEKSTFK
ncbi:hypothetical protein L9F63_002636 [Diploptera punctata]|uniref:MTOR-associated protein MEAK7 n=1 Tax=Diploptera punctata TaxID=6984 RepID=A0AAD7ZRJ5_DIPPU|nr:hypothetical protein L9F63_002636 [Diploptera punctata]